MRLSDRLDRLPVSGIRKMFSLAEKYDDTINLCIGEPGFDTPSHIIEKGCWALQNGYTKYVANAGIMPLREALADKMNCDNGFNVKAENIMVNFGAGQALMETMQVILNPGDDILVPNPCFSNYFGYIALAGANAITVPTYEKDHFHIKAEILEKYITEKTKAIFINTPCNPTGAVTPLEDLEKIAELAKKYDLIIVSDEPYEKIIFDNNKHVSIGSLPGMFERTITVNSFSKTYAMTGWRLGYAVAPAEVIKAMIQVQGPLTANVTAAMQFGGIAALTESQSCVNEMVQEYLKRRNILVKGLNEIKGISCLMPEGAFYAFANIQDVGMSAKDVAIKLLDEVQVVTTPGDAFGPAGEGFLRFSFAASEDNIVAALERMKNCLGEK
ncbi:pyridoxal phosphate-dependent aminotransferase [Peptococcus simiae]|uniref:pyridoxal phosphate-dependent aminotransferase n=1 Tax=Peptococcus simiae TaxID=1643805 RepID=UPI00397F954C